MQSTGGTPLNAHITQKQRKKAAISIYTSVASKKKCHRLRSWWEHCSMQLKRVLRLQNATDSTRACIIWNEFLMTQLTGAFSSSIPNLRSFRQKSFKTPSRKVKFVTQSVRLVSLPAHGSHTRDKRGVGARLYTRRKRWQLDNTYESVITGN